MKKFADKPMLRSEKGSILIFAVVVLMFFSGLAVFLRSIYDPQTVLDAKGAEQITRADTVINSGFDALALMVADEAGSLSMLVSDETHHVGEKLLEALNDVSEITIEDKDGKLFGKLSTSKRFVATDLIIDTDEKNKGVWVRSFFKVTWKVELADGTTLTRKKPLSIYFRFR